MPHPASSNSVGPQLQALAKAGQTALSRYGISSAKLTFLRRTRQTTFKVTTNNPVLLPGSSSYEANTCLLRLYRSSPGRTDSRSEDNGARMSAEWLSMLVRDKVTVVPEPIRTLSGELVLNVESADHSGPVSVCLTRWVQGEKCKLAVDTAHAIGVLMAKLHEHAISVASSDGIGIGKPPNIITNDPLRTPGSPERAFLGEECEKLCTIAIGRVRDLSHTLETMPRVAGIVHGDLVEKNCLVHEGDLRPIDFGECKHAFFAWDIAKVFAQWRMENAMAMREGNTNTLCEAFMRGYSSLRSLSETEEKGIRILMAAWLVNATGWFAAQRREMDKRTQSDLLAARLPVVLDHLGALTR